MKGWKDCPTCWGTGFVRGFGAPCNKKPPDDPYCGIDLGLDYEFAQGNKIDYVDILSNGKFDQNLIDMIARNKKAIADAIGALPPKKRQPWQCADPNCDQCGPSGEA